MNDIYRYITEDFDGTCLWIQRGDFINPEDYLDCLLFLTTRPMNTLYKNGRLVAGVANSCCSFTYYTPSSPADTIVNYFWDNYTWICITLLAPASGGYEHGEMWLHFKMASDREIKYPPIPKFLVDFWVEQEKLL